MKQRHQRQRRTQITVPADAPWVTVRRRRPTSGAPPHPESSWPGYLKSGVIALVITAIVVEPGLILVGFGGALLLGLVTRRWR